MKMNLWLLPAVLVVITLFLNGEVTGERIRRKRQNFKDTPNHVDRKIEIKESQKLEQSIQQVPAITKEEFVDVERNLFELPKKSHDEIKKRYKRGRRFKFRSGGGGGSGEFWVVMCIALFMGVIWCLIKSCCDDDDDDDADVENAQAETETATSC